MPLTHPLVRLHRLAECRHKAHPLHWLRVLAAHHVIKTTARDFTISHPSEGKGNNVIVPRGRVGSGVNNTVHGLFPGDRDLGGGGRYAHAVTHK